MVGVVLVLENVLEFSMSELSTADKTAKSRRVAITMGTQTKNERSRRHSKQSRVVCYMSKCFVLVVFIRCSVFGSLYARSVESVAVYSRFLAS